jgi:hypothetical protein
MLEMVALLAMITDRRRRPEFSLILLIVRHSMKCQSLRSTSMSCYSHSDNLFSQGKSAD